MSLFARLKFGRFLHSFVFARVGHSAGLPRGLKRHYGQGDLHFVTFCCYHRRHYLESVRAKNLFLKILAQVRGKFGFRLVGYVVMPDHVHLLVSEPEKDNLSRVMLVLKQRVSRRMRGKRRRGTKGQLSLSFDDAMATDRRFWQRRFYDLNVWSDAKRKEKLHYMHATPQGLALEQLFVLCPGRGRLNPHGSGGLTSVECSFKTRPPIRPWTKSGPPLQKPQG